MHKGIQIVGCPVDPNWTIQMCLACRTKHYTQLEESFPYAAQKNFVDTDTISKIYSLPYEEYESVPRIRCLDGGWKYPESSIIKLARSMFGGDVGIKAMATGSLDERFKSTDRKIMSYSYR